MCSTPLGVTDLVTPDPAVDVPSDSSVLNASRRHRLGHARCRRDLHRRRAVLNASRRHRLGHVRAGGSRIGAGACSTPLGVTDLVTRPASRRSRPQMSAQRLSASQTWSRRERPRPRRRPDECSTPLGVTDLVTTAHCAVGHRCRECSTPLGVTDLVTRSARAGRSAVGVLNASRRHRLGHDRDVIAAFAASRVLNASRRHRLGHAADGGDAGLGPWCSTPLGVTDLVTSQPAAGPARSGGVLNASRRHRLGHAPGPRRRTPPGRVLNASRRHRLGHPWATAGRHVGRRVLNASRRHRLGHQADAAGAVRRPYECSTPLGVTDLVTARTDPLATKGLRATLFKRLVAADRKRLFPELEPAPCRNRK